MSVGAVTAAAAATLAACLQASRGEDEKAGVRILVEGLAVGDRGVVKFPDVGMKADR